MSGKSEPKEHIPLPTNSKAIRRSISPNPPGSVDSHTPASTADAPHSPSRSPKRIDDEDDGDEPDPENPETPWTCTPALRHPFPSYSSARPPYPASSPPPCILTVSAMSALLPAAQPELRVKVKVAVPTPHYPNVVAPAKLYPRYPISKA
ncbi:hypothetical protein NLI96_g7811 [Meripilus lineatus]|uniref:Uncharacterized protein n=1 Tax=Meripilus lineatus TaxID=2056292 RepID=A0AAD5YGW0_9APHY|nr:hypothetical protein NLI96_g7811 [Physisporinus lineatus]